MSVRQIFSETAPAPIGPYSQATQVGSLMFVSGMIPINPKTGELQLFEGNAAKQCRLILTTLTQFLKSQGKSLADVAKTTIYLTHMEDFATVNEVYGEFFNTHKPARACVEVSALPKGVSVEIEAIVAM